MHVKVASLKSMVDAHGALMNEGETVTLLNDLCLFAPGSDSGRADHVGGHGRPTGASDLHQRRTRGARRADVQRGRRVGELRFRRPGHGVGRRQERHEDAMVDAEQGVSRVRQASADGGWRRGVGTRRAVPTRISGSKSWTSRTTSGGDGNTLAGRGIRSAHRFYLGAVAGIGGGPIALRPPRGCPMKKLVLLLSVALASCTAPSPDVARWEQQARNVTITRDDWGIPHVKGKTDADAVFGMIYAQAEDDFNRVEVNYLNAMGRLAEAEGEGAIYRDPPNEALRRPHRPSGAVRDEPGMAEDPDECVGRRTELLPVQPSGYETEGHCALRAVDGAQLQRGEHWRRHRGRVTEGARGVLWRQESERRGHRPHGASRGTDGLQWLRHRAVEQRQQARTAAHQPAHVVLLPRGTADDERRGD